MATSAGGAKAWIPLHLTTEFGGDSGLLVGREGRLLPVRAGHASRHQVRPRFLRVVEQPAFGEKRRCKNARIARRAPYGGTFSLVGGAPEREMTEELDGDVGREQCRERAAYTGNRFVFGFDVMPVEYTRDAWVPETDVAEPG